MPTPRGKLVRTSTLRMPSHARSTTGRSVTGILHLVNSTPIDWYSKLQNSVETATYGSEFVVWQLNKSWTCRILFRSPGVYPMAKPTCSATMKVSSPAHYSPFILEQTTQRIVLSSKRKGKLYHVLWFSTYRKGQSAGSSQSSV
jgi:hypothetical protein